MRDFLCFARLLASRLAAALCLRTSSHDVEDWPRRGFRVQPASGLEGLLSHVKFLSPLGLAQPRYKQVCWWRLSTVGKLMSATPELGSSANANLRVRA